MGLFVNLYSRVYQGVMWAASFFLNFNEPKYFTNDKDDNMDIVPLTLKGDNKKKALIVTDDQLFNIGLITPLLESFERNGMGYVLFHNVFANPSVDSVEEGLKLYLDNNCDCLVALGGGSPIDCCKAIGARVVKPKKNVNQLKGVLKVMHKIPTMFTIPTTAGTGSETTVASVIVDKSKGDKYAINDPCLIPKYCMFAPKLLSKLPKNIASTTGMDALTHAVEAYIGHSNTRKTKRCAKEAVVDIFKYLELSCDEPNNLEVRLKMQLASYNAGIAFTRAYVGTVHSIAHSIGGKYNVPHGLANAIILPMVLKAYGKSAHKKLSNLATLIGIDGNSNEERANKFIGAIEDMNNRLGITNTFGNLIKEEDLDFLVNHAYKETVPLYPVPRILSKDELRDLYLKLKNN